ncbi:disease resistance protein (TIR-NBS-LRR class), putative, partial [Medicago truncatula]
IEVLDDGGHKNRFFPPYKGVGLFPERIVCSMHNLKLLIIGNFHELKVLPDDLHCLSVLEELHISRCDELESFSMHALQGMISLRVLTIDLCGKLISLSEGMGDLASLERLVIHGCSQLVLPSKMNKLTSLRQVNISHSGRNNRILQGLEVIPSLQNLTLSYCDHLPESLGAMTSLQRVEIISCTNAKSLPNSFQNLINLHTLLIVGCSKLEKRCKKGTGEDWQKIAHVPELELIAKKTY